MRAGRCADDSCSNLGIPLGGPCMEPAYPLDGYAEDLRPSRPHRRPASTAPGATGDPDRIPNIQAHSLHPLKTMTRLQGVPMGCSATTRS
ncbi:hypothetical protein HMPREF1550_00970 [Actinomyces sp. oral taxon 877 str. F0543]|nr:hypothetical protein HMPREF1550_00970 [Actinomyces sp. oral taxon 877 str. F0543]